MLATNQSLENGTFVFISLFLFQCEACNSLLNGSYVLPPEVGEVMLVPRVTVAFHMRLRSNIIVARRTFMELKNFHQVQIFNYQKPSLARRNNKIYDELKG